MFKSIFKKQNFNLVLIINLQASVESANPFAEAHS